MSVKIAIAGYGQEGKVNFAYWNQAGNDITIVDERESLDDVPENVSTILGKNAFKQLQDFDLVIRTAGLNPSKIMTNGTMWSATNEFFEQCPAPIIGVTGTKGKGTTCSLIASILRASGKTVHLVGNIGVPALHELKNIQPDDTVVFELSSFQLWDLKKSPQTAVVLKVESDHLDVHDDMDDYIAAKAQIARYMKQDQTVYYHPTYENSKRVATMYGRATARRYGIADDGGAYVNDGHFKIGDTQICSVDVMQIPGEHNIENACASISAAYEYTQDIVGIKNGLHDFTGLPHRLKLIREVDGVKYFDDSYSSAPSAAIAAIRAHSQPQVVLLGGYDKGASFDDLAQELKQSSVKKAIIYGNTRQKIADAMAMAGVDSSRFEVLDTTDFSLIVRTAVEQANEGDIVVLSPACASFDMFKNFTERGNTFISIIENL